MTNNKKYLLTGFAAAGVIIAMINFTTVSEKPEYATEKIDRFLGVTNSSSELIFSDEHFFSNMKFSKDIADKNTVDLFKFLQFKFQNDNLDDHYAEVLNYLISLHGETRAKELLELYKKFTQYEMELTHAKFFKRQQPASASEALEFLNEIKNHRENVFTKEIADSLFSDEHKMYEYKIMVNEIVKDPDIYGSEKEKEISALQENLAYKPDEEFDMSEFDRYNMKLKLYQKDLSGLNAQQQKEMMQKFRREIFTADEASRLEQLELHNEQEEQRQKGIPDHD
ncbi:MAG: hypothetical protein CVV49_12780 [Spirochaetae bacterium HGW-Spirochaetae-5]|nr:MAG: hypothetical protein CVV49_12780 [Spirochaetae bacterium HGW-Spirochaetae-5]